MLRLVSFDLDGTLIHPAIFNAVAEPLGFADKLEETTRAYFAGEMTADETFHADYKHFVGRRVDEMLDALRTSDRWTPGIADAVSRFHDAGVRVAVTTDQPDFLVVITRELFAVDDFVCTSAEVKHGRVTGSYQLQHDKWTNLARLLKARHIDASEVAHVGNGSNDVPVFQHVGDSIAVWPMNEAVRRAAKWCIEKPTGLFEVADLLLARGS